MSNELILKGKSAKTASVILGNSGSATKDFALEAMAKALVENAQDILSANLIDVENAKTKGVKGALIDRLTLNISRIEGMAEGILQIKSLPDPVGEVLSMWQRPNGLQIGRKRVSIGVIGIIYEARPNVTADAAALCLKSSNVVILRGGSEAINSNKAIVSVLRSAIASAGLPSDCICLVEDTARETAVEMMKLNEYIDLLIPRGGAGLIQTVVKNSTVPVIETGIGNCHTYVDDDSDLKMALDIAVNAKCSRPGVCNAMETLLVNRAVADEFLPMLENGLNPYNVEIRGDAETQAIISTVKPATEDDWATEFLDYILAVKVVGDVDEAIAHISKYGTKHSEAIITNNYANSQKFLQQIDASAVYINASTRFTDGYEFGFGAEIGISTQKMHARGPMGLEALTTIKYIIFGNGQIR